MKIMNAKPLLSIAAVFVIIVFGSCNHASGEFEILGYDRSDCQGSPDQTSQAAGHAAHSQDRVEIRLDGLVLYITHHDAVYNCCVDDIRFTLEREGNRIRLFEEEIRPNCYCICKYDLSVQVQTPGAGTYDLEIWNKNAQTLLWSGSVTVPGN